jgi:S-adenosylmethionine-dependent methyltransferase
MSVADLAAVFDAKASAWQDYNASTVGRLRHKIVLHHLLSYLGDSPCDVFDVGCGTGELAADLAAGGHNLTLLDFSPGMLTIAEQRCADYAARTVCADATQAVDRLGPESFDAVLCHSLLEFAPDPAQLLDVLVQLVRPGGLLSLLIGNRCHAPLRSALIEWDFPRALRELDGDPPGEDLFGLPRRTFDPDELAGMLRARGLRITREAGVRVFADLLPPLDGIPDDLLALELAASTRLPYRRLARFVLFIAVKEESK